MYDYRGKNGLSESFAELLELVPVLCHLDTLVICSEKLTVTFGKNSLLFELHCKVKSGLSADSGKDRIGSFGSYDPRNIFEVERFHINPVRNRCVGHDRRRIGIAQNDFVPFFLECKTRLCSRIVELGCLSDDYGTRAYNKYFVYVSSLRHFKTSVRNL